MKSFPSILRKSIFQCTFILAAVLLPPLVHAQWRATAGAQSNDKGQQALAFLPNEIWIHPGNSITWTFPADEIHTVTFLKVNPPPSQVRPFFRVGCPGTTSDGSPFDGSKCVTTGPLASGDKPYTVMFPIPGNYKLVCLVHPNMTAVVHVLPAAETLPHDQDFYDDQAAQQRSALLEDKDHNRSEKGRALSEAKHHDHATSFGEVTVGTGEVIATGGGSQGASVMRFLHGKTVVHVGDTVEWTSEDPSNPHTVTFGVEPGNPVPPSANVTVDADGALHAVINLLNLPSDSVHSGFLDAAPQERTGLPQSPLSVTRFRITFTHAGTFPYICALHDGLGMKGEVIVLP
jgi:plastocyanin